MQLRGHLQKDFKFVNLWFILRCGDIQLDQSIDIFLTGSHANAQVGGLAPGGTDTTSLQTKFVEPAVFGSGFAKPMMGKCLIHPARKKKLAKRAFDSKSFEGFLLFFSPTIAKIGSRLFDFTGFAFSLWECTVENNFRGLIIAVDMGGRQ